MKYILTDGRDATFRIETEDLNDIIEYLDYPEYFGQDEVEEALEEENDGMDFYRLEANNVKI